MERLEWITNKTKVADITITIFTLKWDYINMYLDFQNHQKTPENTGRLQMRWADDLKRTADIR